VWRGKKGIEMKRKFSFEKKKKKCSGWDSNLGPSGCQARALTITPRGTLWHIELRKVYNHINRNNQKSNYLIIMLIRQLIKRQKICCTTRNHPLPYPYSLTSIRPTVTENSRGNDFKCWTRRRRRRRRIFDQCKTVDSPFFKRGV
jgi:hypothetical protein